MLIVSIFTSFLSVCNNSQRIELRSDFAQVTENKVNEINVLPKFEALPRLENPRIVVKKSQRKLELFDGEKLIKTYKIALGFAPVGDKEKEGDGKTPEGEFYIFTKNEKSKFYLSFGVSYPNIEDAKRGLEIKLISKIEYAQIVEAVKNKKAPPQKTKLGGEIYIHGGGNSADWTWGCVALENAEIKEIFDAISIGTFIKIES